MRHTRHRYRNRKDCREKTDRRKLVQWAMRDQGGISRDKVHHQPARTGGLSASRSSRGPTVTLCQVRRMRMRCGMARTAVRWRLTGGGAWVLSPPLPRRG